jgi:hypothetical protein
LGRKDVNFLVQITRISDSKVIGEKSYRSEEILDLDSKEKKCFWLKVDLVEDIYENILNRSEKSFINE